jgi:hypothetical protein
MRSWRSLLVVLLATLSATYAQAQTYSLTEALHPGDCFRYDLSMTLKGELRVNKDGRAVSIPLAATAQHQFTERLLEVKNEKAPLKAARNYSVARAISQVNGAGHERTLRDERRLLVAQRFQGQFLCYSPDGAMTRDEKELVSEHFDTLALAGLLPPADVKLEETWKIPNETAQALCLYEGLISNELVAKLERIEDGFAIISISGKTQGIDLGALVMETITATARYEILPKWITRLEWTQKDERDQGPASPASTLEATTIIQRQVSQQPKELSDAALEAVPKGFEPPAALTLVYQADAKNRYDLAVARDWQLVAQTDTHMVLRLLDRGDLIAQATITAWPKADAGKHLEAEEFKKITSETPGWQMEDVVEAGEMPGEAGRYVYRISARGIMDEVKVIQYFYLIAGANGDQVIITLTLKPNQASKLGTRDLTLIGSIGFPKK